MRKMLFVVALSIALSAPAYAKDDNGNHYGNNGNQGNKSWNANKNTNINTNRNTNTNLNVNSNTNIAAAVASVSGVTTGNNTISVTEEENPTNINFGAVPEMGIANMTHFPLDANWNTQLTVINDKECWAGLDVDGAEYNSVKLNGKVLRISTQEQFSCVRVYKEVPKDAIVLFKGAAFTDKADLSMADCELTALNKARELKGSGIVIIKQGFSIASRTKQKGFGIGTTGSAVERMGGLGITLPIGFMWATAMGDGVAQPWMTFAIIEVK